MDLDPSWGRDEGRGAEGGGPAAAFETPRAKNPGGRGGDVAVEAGAVPGGGSKTNHGRRRASRSSRSRSPPSTLRSISEVECDPSGSDVEAAFQRFAQHKGLKAVRARGPEHPPVPADEEASHYDDPSVGVLSSLATCVTLTTGTGGGGRGSPDSRSLRWSPTVDVSGVLEGGTWPGPGGDSWLEPPRA